MLTLVQGPAGGGKSQVTADMLASGEVDILADVTALWVALSGAVRGPDGRFPVRLEDDPALAVARYLQTVAARVGLRDGFNVAVTTSQRDQETRWQRIANETGAPFRVRTVDPGRDVVTARLSDSDGTLSPECAKAIRRWFR